MISGALSLRYVLADSAADLVPEFTLQPAAAPGEIRFSGTNMRSVDRLDVSWSTRDLMKVDPVKAYLAKIGAKGRAANTPAQQKAAKVNGTKGGRPKGAKDSKPRTRKSSNG